MFWAIPSSTMSRPSRLQRQVLSLYRQLQLLRSGHATAMGAFVRRQGQIQEPIGTETPKTPPKDGDGLKSPLDGMGSPETPPDGR